MSKLHTILGANGTIAVPLSKELLPYTNRIRQVSRNPRKVNEQDELVAANLLNAAETDKAVAGSDVVYLLAGLTYKTSVWQEQWPVLMRNVLDACMRHRSRLVFFDNVYAYGKVDGIMTESTPFNPSSKKGEVRAKIAAMLLEETKKGNLDALIVRAADFYGPGAVLSMTYATVTERIKAGKTCQWMGDPGKVHTFTYTPDAARSVALLGNTDAAYNQTWHALTTKQLYSGNDYIRIACELAGRPFKVQALPTFGVRALGLFVPILREMVEMMYQYTSDYQFDSSKFEKQFQLTATSYEEGIAATLK
ncbi:MAG: NAD-dependent epimerase/dehydratase family protein [Cyclobacteriaceae bacterium]|nr:NAD-dependent epimerase/dehydratase family protein [Cyclobacteriaceae bacterium]